MDDIDLGEEAEVDEATLKNKPNYLQLTLEKGRNLVVEKGRTAIDPEATISVIDQLIISTISVVVCIIVFINSSSFAHDNNRLK
jgi:hypothetical protein